MAVLRNDVKYWNKIHNKKRKRSPYKVDDNIM